MNIATQLKIMLAWHIYLILWILNYLYLSIPISSIYMCILDNIRVDLVFWFEMTISVVSLLSIEVFRQLTFNIISVQLGLYLWCCYVFLLVPSVFCSIIFMFLFLLLGKVVIKSYLYFNYWFYCFILFLLVALGFIIHMFTL